MGVAATELKESSILAWRDDYRRLNRRFGLKMDVCDPHETDLSSEDEGSSISTVRRDSMHPSLAGDILVAFSQVRWLLLTEICCTEGKQKLAGTESKRY